MKIWFQKQLRKHKSIVSIMLLCVGLIMILISRGDPILSGLGISILASAITTLITIFFIDDEDRYEDIKEWGLEHVYPSRGAMNPVCDAYMAKARSIRIIAFGLRSMRDSQTAVIKQILQKGGRIQIITMDPDCDNLRSRERDENQAISDSIRGLIDWAKKINAESAGSRIEIRMHDHLPQDFLFLMDNRLFTGPYAYGISSQQTISYEYNIIGKAYEHYQDLFERLWNDRDFCRDALELEMGEN